MIKGLLFLLALMLQALPASAVNAPNYPATITNFKFNGAPARPDAETACMCVMDSAGCAPKIGAVNKSVYSLDGPANITASHNCKVAYTNGTFSAKLGLETYFSCPYGGTAPAYQGSATTSVVMCTNVPEGGGPAPSNPCKAGTRVTVTYQTGTFTPPQSYTVDPSKVPNVNGASDGACKITIDDVKGCVGRADGKSYCTYSGTQTGEQMAPGGTGGGPAPSGEAASSSSTDTQVPVPPFTGKPGGGCPTGTVQGGVGPDGVPMCMGTGSNPPLPPKTPSTTTKPPTTTTGSDGSSTTTQQTSQQNADGSTTTTTTTTTTAPDGTKTTSTSSTNSGTSGGAPGRTDTPTEDKTNFCKQNPNLSICRESSVSGSCGQTSCVGDAIQCATLRAAAAMQCKQKEDDDALKASPLHSLGQAASSGNDPMASTLPTVANASVVNLPTMAASGWIGGGAAFRDVSFTVQNKSFTIPLEKWTGYLVGLRYALMVVAMLVSFRMLSGVILRD